ncbi:MAG TPA: hypothetical protein VEB20_03485 [Azospirillaceae bacterium]|nr:hypothetical protein [Azospirillaceae bacterium]
MSEHDTVMTAGGRAEWGRLVRIGDGLSTVAYQTWSAVRLRIQDRGDRHLTCFFTGMDEVTDGGRVTSGFGHAVMTEHDGDELWARVDWSIDGDRDIGRFTFQSGTGKWAGAAGTVTGQLFLLPSAGESSHIGFYEGHGRVTLA